MFSLQFLGDFFLVFLPSFWELTAGNPWYSLVCKHIIAVSACLSHEVLLCVSMSRCLSSYKHTSHWIRPILIHYDLILTSLHLKRHHFQIWGLPYNYWGLGFQHILGGGDNLTHNLVNAYLPSQTV